jgi:hypothetical protein
MELYQRLPTIAWLCRHLGVAPHNLKGARARLVDERILYKAGSTFHKGGDLRRFVEVEVAPGGVVPTPVELGERFGVEQSAAHRWLGALGAEGVLERRRVGPGPRRWIRADGEPQARRSAAERLLELLDNAEPGERLGSREGLADELGIGTNRLTALARPFRLHGAMAVSPGRNGGFFKAADVPPEQRGVLLSEARAALGLDVSRDVVQGRFSWVAAHCRREAIRSAATYGVVVLRRWIQRAEATDAELEQLGPVQWLAGGDGGGLALAERDDGSRLLLAAGKRDDALARASSVLTRLNAEGKLPAPERDATITMTAFRQTRADAQFGAAARGICIEFRRRDLQLPSGRSTLEWKGTPLTLATFDQLALLVVTGPAHGPAGDIARREANALVRLEDELRTDNR